MITDIGSMMLQIGALSLSAGLLVGCASVKTPEPAQADSHVTKLTVVPGEKGHFWIMDGSEKIALFGSASGKDPNYQLGLIRQFPGQAVPDAWLKEPEVMHFVTRYGLGLALTWVNAILGDQPAAMSYDASAPGRLKINIKTRNPKGDEGTVAASVFYDARLGRYVVESEFHLTSNTRGGGEFCNFYPHGLGDFRPDVGMYDRLIWQEPDGSTKAHWLSFPAAQPGSIPLSPTGMVAYVENPWGTPAVQFESCDPPGEIHVCHCWFDSHLCWTEPKDMPGPPYHYSAKLKAWWLKPDEAAALKAKAAIVPIEPLAERWQQMVPIEMGKVNGFEERADLKAGKVKRIYLQLGSGVSWDASVARTGSHSILLQSTRPEGITTMVTGPELMVTPGKRVKISAWVKTENIIGEGFHLESGFRRWIPNGDGDIGKMIQSEALFSTNNWTRLEIPMPVTPVDAEFLKGRITFVLKGIGKVWVDDLEFAESDE